MRARRHHGYRAGMLDALAPLVGLPQRSRALQELRERAQEGYAEGYFEGLSVGLDLAALARAKREAEAVPPTLPSWVSRSRHEGYVRGWCVDGEREVDTFRALMPGEACGCGCTPGAGTHENPALTRLGIPVEAPSLAMGDDAAAAE